MQIKGAHAIDLGAADMTRTSASPVVLEWLTQAQRGTGVGSCCRAKPEGRRGRWEPGARQAWRDREAALRDENRETRSGPAGDASEA